MPSLESYTKTGSKKSWIEASPDAVHIRGFQANKPKKTTVRLINRGKKPIRTHIIGPQTADFSIDYNRKVESAGEQAMTAHLMFLLQGLLIPGAAEVITVKFTGKELRYYTDSIRVHVQVRGISQTRDC
jgi:hypothetical protein